MSQATASDSLPSRLLYTMLRVSDLEQSIDFYRRALGMEELRRETFTEGRFTLVFMGYAKDPNGALLELTYNWDPSDYQLGNAYGHIALLVKDIYAACQRLEAMGVNVVRPAGPMTFAADETGEKELIAFIEDPDGYRVELIGGVAAP